jgi:hypothetical protein
MQLLTRRACEEVVIDKAARVVVQETAANQVKLAVVDPTNGFRTGVRETGPNAERDTGRRVAVIAPYGEWIEIDA